MNAHVALQRFGEPSENPAGAQAAPLTPDTIPAMADALAALVDIGAGTNPVQMRPIAELAGWAGLDLPQRLGGAGWSVRDMAKLFLHCGRHDAELRDAVGAGHARLITLAGTRKFDGFLSAVANGSAYCAIALTEPDAGSDLQALKTTATPVDGGYRINGIKQHISRIEECSHLIVFASVARGGAPGQITPFLVPRHATGLSIERGRPMGMSTVSWGKVELHDVRVPVGARIGGEGQGLALFMRHFCYWRLMMAATAIGAAQRAVDLSAARMKSRQAFGGPIGRFTHMQQALAQHVGRLRMAWLLIDDVARQMGDGSWPVFDAAMAKAESLEAAAAATDWAISVFGAAGYDSDTGIEKRHRDIMGLRIADGTTDVLRGQVARAVLGDGLYELSLSRRGGGFESDSARRNFW